MNLGRLVWVNTIPELVRIALVKFPSNPWLTEGSLVFPLCHHILCTLRQCSLRAVHTQVSDGTSLRIVSCVPSLLPSALWLPVHLRTRRRTGYPVVSGHSPCGPHWTYPLSRCHVTKWLSGSIDLCLFDSIAGPDMGRKWNLFSQCLKDWEISFLFLSEASLEDIAQYEKQKYIYIYIFFFNIHLSFSNSFLI